jgi:hypothetical protein
MALGRLGPLAYPSVWVLIAAANIVGVKQLYDNGPSSAGKSDR